MSFLAGVGMIFSAYGNMRANAARVTAEERNASYYKEQADYLAEVGERQELLFERESKILLGDQASSFAKAGVSTQSNELFMAKEMLFRDQEKYAIQRESDMNERLALLRADQSSRTAKQLDSWENKAGIIWGGAMGSASGYM